MSETKKQNNNFLLHGGILALASVLVRFIGMIYRIPMVNIIGSEGNGYYSNAYSVYNILLLLSSYSLPLAVSKMVSARVALGKWKETKRILVVAFVFAAVIGLIFGAVTFFGADFFCTKILNSPNSAIALKWMAPTVFIMAVLGVLRGFFQGLQTMIPTAVSQIFEQIINAIFSVAMAAVLVCVGAGMVTAGGDPALRAAWGAAGGTIGTGAGALAALIFFIILYSKYRNTLNNKVAKDLSKKVRPYGELLKILSLTAVPVILATATYNAVDILDAALFNHAMARQGLTNAQYTSIWGDYNSAYLLLVHLPVALASAIGSALVPSLSSAYAEKDKQQVLEKVTLTVRVTLLISIPCAFGMMAVGGNLAKLLFSGIAEDARHYLVVGGLAVVFYSLSTVTNAILQGLNHMERPVLHAFIALVGHVLLLLLLLYVFKAGVYAVIVSYMLFSLCIAVLNLISIRKLTGYRINPIRSIMYPGLVSLVMVLVCLLISFLFAKILSGRLLHLVVVLLSLLVGAAIYVVGICLLKCITKKQVKELPYGKKIAAFLTKLRLLK